MLAHSTDGQGGDYYEMSSDVVRQRSEVVSSDDNNGVTADVEKPLIEP